MAMKNKFDGVYAKITDDTNSIAFIAGRTKDTAFIQVITPENSFSINFDELTPIKYDAMGPFKFLPFMECKHKVISMNHRATANFNLNGKEYNFQNANGYIEGDRGKSFPKKYFWTQCGDRTNSIMASVARIPYLCFKFTGTICIINIGGKEYRLATYLGARVKIFSRDHILIKQGRKILEIRVPEASNLQPLDAPNLGEMTRTIKETIFTTVSYKFTIGKKTVLDYTANNAAYEYSD